ncbi:DUF397 domain-containing protein [Kitasatospora sp. NPDC101183]|uniref:DUF397 domain-containing protein n=1 Tax=Kitasatospora sp. NPDC101183 TaxID=3364100 RepID=UPI0037F5CE61
MNRSEWQTSSYTANNNNCIEVRTFDGLIEFRESDEGDVIVRTTRHKFAELLQGAQEGEFDRHATT